MIDNYSTAVHEAGHILGYANWGFTEFLVSTNEPGFHATVKTIGETDRNYTKSDYEIVCLMGPEAEFALTGDEDEYANGAMFDWFNVFNRNIDPADLEALDNIANDRRTAIAQNYVTNYWTEIVEVADRIANGERRIRYEL